MAIIVSIVTKMSDFVPSDSRALNDKLLAYQLLRPYYSLIVKRFTDSEVVGFADKLYEQVIAIHKQPRLMKISISPESSSIVSKIDVHVQYFSGRRETPYGHHTTEGEHEREGPSGGNDDHDVVVFVLCVSTEVEHSLRQYCRHHHRHGDYGGRDRIPVLYDQCHLIKTSMY